MNFWKHGVSFEEAATVWDDALSVFRTDPNHSMGEWRYLVLGMSDRQRLLVVAFAEGQSRVRLISARRASSTERRRYEEEERY